MDNFNYINISRMFAQENILLSKIYFGSVIGLYFTIIFRTLHKKKEKSLRNNSKKNFPKYKHE